MGGLAAFSLASLLGGLAPSAAVLIVARAAQGCAAAVMTPQVLSIIQVQFDGQRRARAIGAYSMILAVGVAAGQIIGGLIVSAHLLAAAWRPALLVNAPVGAVLLICCRRALPPMAPGSGKSLDGAGSALLAAALLALIVPLTVGRADGWPTWIWPSLLASVLAGWAFTRHERRRSRRGSDPLFDLAVLKTPGVTAGMLAVLLIMACYAGFLLALTLHLQQRLGFSPLHAGLIFAIYATGFGAASLSWTRFPTRTRERLPVIGPLLMGATLVAVGLLASNTGWSLASTAPLLLAAGVGHAWGFAPVASRLTTLVAPSRAADLTGLLITADWIGTVLGVATFTGIYLSTEAHGSARALALTTIAIAAALVATAVGAARATAKARTPTACLPAAG